MNLNRIYEIGKKFRNEGVDLTNNLSSPPVIWLLQHAIFYKEQEGEIYFKSLAKYGSNVIIIAGN